MSSLVAPPAGAFGINQGTLGVQVNDRDGKGVAGVAVAITGPASDTNLTNSAGCAIFPYIPIGTYAASVTQAGSVDRNGNSARHASPGPSPTARSASRRSISTGPRASR